MCIRDSSKTYAMTGWRIGYAAGPKKVIKAMTSFQSHASSNANSIAQYAAATALSCGDTYIKSMITEYDVRRRLMHRMLNAVSYTHLDAYKRQGYSSFTLGRVLKPHQLSYSSGQLMKLYQPRYGLSGSEYAPLPP